MAKTLEEEKGKRISKEKEKFEIYFASSVLFLLLATLLFAIGIFLPSETLRPYAMLWAPILLFSLSSATVFIFLASTAKKRIEQLESEQC